MIANDKLRDKVSHPGKLVICVLYIWKCRYCGKTSTFSDDKKASNASFKRHEERCTYNPANKLCDTCKYNYECKMIRHRGYGSKGNPCTSWIKKQRPRNYGRLWT